MMQSFPDPKVFFWIPIQKSISQIKILFFDWMIVKHSNLQLSFLPFNKFKSKNLGEL